MSCIGRWESPTNEREGLAFGDFNLVHGIRKERYVFRICRTVAQGNLKKVYISLCSVESKPYN